MVDYNNHYLLLVAVCYLGQADTGSAQVVGRSVASPGPQSTLRRRQASYQGM